MLHCNGFYSKYVPFPTQTTEFSTYLCGQRVCFPHNPQSFPHGFLRKIGCFTIFDKVFHIYVWKTLWVMWKNGYHRFFTTQIKMPWKIITFISRKVLKNPYR